MKRKINTPRYTNLKEEKKLMKNKSNLLKFTNIVLLITMIAIILVAGTFAKYTSTASGTSATVVANWSFKVNNEDITILGADENISFNLFNTANIKDSDGSAEEDVAAGLIAPGTSGAFEFKLENTSEVTAEYEIKLDVTNTDNIPLEFSFTGEEDSWTTDLTNLLATDVMAIGSSKNVTVQWRWPFGDTTVTDATLAGKTVTVDAKITATQVDKSDINNSDIKYVEKPIFANITEQFDESKIASGNSFNLPYAPFAYTNLDLFSGKTITKIGIPVKSVPSLQENATFTLYTVKKAPLAEEKATTASNTYTLEVPVSQFESTTINDWVYLDLSGENITVAEDETLAFFAASDTVVLSYQRTSISNEYTFSAKVLSEYSTVSVSDNLFMDVYYQDVETNEDKVSLVEALDGKTLSILGDSISTFQDYSNDITNNSTIGNNNVYFSVTTDKGINNVNDSWWMQTINNNNMNLLVNNSWSGSTVFENTNSQGLNSIAYNTTRPVNLHDNTDDTTFANGTEPDIIATYIGINDFNTNYEKIGTDVINFNTLINNGDYATPTTVIEAYAIMVHKMVTRYTNSDIYLFTMLPNTWHEDDALLETFNSGIKNIANEYNLNVVDLYTNSGITRSNISTYLKDGIHPNELGMDKITETFENALRNKYLNN